MGIPTRTLLRSRRALIVLALAGFYLIALLAFRDSATLDPDAVETAMRDAAGYLVRHLDDHGRFVYSVRLEGKARQDEYNVLRHAEALQALSAYHDLTPSAETREVLLRGATYLLKRHVRTVARHPGLRAVYSLPGEEMKGTNALIKLGGCGLGLCVLTKAHRLDSAAVPQSVLRELGNFILFMQESNGRFRSTYDDQAQSFGSFDSLFYPGEAMLGLAWLHRIDPDPRWLEATWNGLTYLAERRRNLPTWRLPPDHWSIIATAEVLEQDGASKSPEARQQLVAHVRAIARKMLREQWNTSWAPGWTGSFGLRAAIPSSATRLEGLTALASLLPAGDPDREAVERSVTSGLEFVLRGQVLSGEARGGFTRALRLPIPYGTEMAGEIRIDYVGHALGALVGWHKGWETTNSQ